MASQCISDKNKSRLCIILMKNDTINYYYPVLKQVSVIYNASNDVILNHISLRCIKTTELNIPTAMK